MFIGGYDGTIRVALLHSLEALVYAARARQITRPAMTSDVPVVRSIQSDDIHRCDRFAAHPEDPRRVTVGTAWDTWETVLQATTACEKLSEQDNPNPRWLYQYGRALQERGISGWDGGEEVDDKKEAIKYYRQASELDYSMAKFELANAYAEGRYIEKDIDMAINLYQQALDGNVKMAAFRLAEIHFQRNSSDLQRTSIKLMKEMATEGDKWAHKELAYLYDGKWPSVAEVKRDQNKVLFHHLLAAGLAANTPYREQFLQEHQIAAHNHASIMDIETVAEVVKAADCWEIGKQRSDVLKIDDQGKVSAVCRN
uniref:Sel1 repeat-containing protein n=1 Tax=Candidatus Kentrum sp. TUN TaxID=2126343 RepID=A0A450ZM91_9GAMM|nr:MAG: Sel1 repeat-containing protein [Candidatus Kentron sp. TUN]